MVDAGKVLNTKQNHESFLPQVERALHLWFCEMRSKPHAPLINQSVLVQKSTLLAFYYCIDSVNMHTTESIIFRTQLYQQCQHETKTYLIHFALQNIKID